ncbi:MAG: MFS transporter [Alphaproteobacteria bacterium]|nr:MFS transporter [Alphaproteobacteria bacterium]OJV14179.1 MAG: hypothetical protein BGO27_01615 [Alphaproteobacteria bacterium 33-17]
MKAGTNHKLLSKIAVVMGNSLDWYDFALYGYFAAVFAKLYFPTNNEFTSVIASFATWGIGFAARPIGSILFGSIGDKYGRVKAFQIASKLIFIPVLLLPIIPTYDQIGLFAPIILVACRLIQGICIGGEFAGGFIYLCETSSKNKRFFMGSIGSCTGLIGILTASFVAMLCYKIFTPLQLETYGFRLAFGLAIIFASISYHLRKNIHETLEYTTAKTLNLPYLGLKDILKHHKKPLLQAFGIVFMHANTFYFVVMFLNTYKTQVLGLQNSNVLSNNTLLLLINLICVPFVGILADKVGGKKILTISALLFIFLSYPLFRMIEVPEYTFVVTFIFTFMTILDSGVVPGLQVSLIPVHIRFTGMSLIFNIVWGIFGGSVPLICLSLIHYSNNKYIPAAYIVFSAFITLITLISMKPKGEIHGKETYCAI